MAVPKTTTLLGPNDTLLSASDDGRLISYVETSGQDQTLFVLDVGSGQKQMISAVHFDAATTDLSQDVGGSISPNGKYILFDSGTGFFIKNLQDNSAPYNVTPQVPQGAEIVPQAIADDGVTIVYGENFTDYYNTQGGDFHGEVVQNIVTGAQQKFSAAYGDIGTGVKLTPDGRYLSYFDGGYVVRDLVGGSVFRPTVFSTGGSVSDTGRYIVYAAAGDASGNPASSGSSQIFLHDNNAPSGVEDRIITTNAFDQIGNGDSYIYALSGDGRHVLFESTATNLVPGEADGNTSLYVKDLDNNTISLVKADIAPQGSETTGSLFVSYDGSRITYPDGTGNVVVTQYAPPTLTVDPISADNLVNAREAYVTVSGTSNAIGQTVHLSLEGTTVVANVVVGTNGTWRTALNIGPPKPDGPHVIDATVTDEVTTTTKLPFTVDTTPPRLTLDAVAGDNVVTFTEAQGFSIDGTSDAIGQRVSLSIDNHAIGQAFVTSSGRWSFDDDGAALAEGEHEIEYSVDDPAGNQTSSSSYFERLHHTNAAPTFFANSGFTLTPVGSQRVSEATSVAVLPDGRLLAGGYANDGGGDVGGNPDFALIRYDADGSLDTTFGSGGTVTTDFGTTPGVNTSEDTGTSLVVQADGKAVLGGGTYSQLDDGSGTTAGGGFLLARYDTGGNLDTSFGTGGEVTTPFGAYAEATGIALDGSKIVAAGIGTTASGDQGFAVARYLADGTLDPTFGTGGVVLTDVGSVITDYGVAQAHATSVAVLSDHGILVAGDASDSSGRYEFALVRYTAAGQLDTTFGAGGVVITDYGSNGGGATSVLALSDGSILVGGYNDDGGNGTTDLTLIRYKADGTLDTSFGHNGEVVTALSSGDDAATSIAVQSDGKIIAGGYGAHEEFAIARYNANGSLDTTFGSDGEVFTAVDSQSFGLNVKLQTDGKIVLAGYAGDTDDAIVSVALARYNDDGSLDTSFGGTTTLGNTVDYIEGGAAVILDDAAAIFDQELAGFNGGAGNYGGATLTLERQGGADAGDVFGPSGDVQFDGSSLLLSGLAIGTVTQAGGRLTIAFVDGASQAQVNAALDAITYANTSSALPAGSTTAIPIAWTFADGNAGLQGDGGAQATTGLTTVDVIAADRFTGASGGVWSNPANWSEGAVPGPMDVVVISSGQPIITTDVGTVGALSIASPASLAITGGHLAVSGDLSGDGRITVTGGADVTLAGASSEATVALLDGKLTLTEPDDFQGTIQGLDNADAIDLSTLNFSPNETAKLLPGNVLEIAVGQGVAAAAFRSFAVQAADATTPTDLQLASSDDFTGRYFHLADDGSGGTLVTVDGVPCYCPGTLVLTAAGEVPVEQIEIGDVLVTAEGAHRPVKWIGRRSYAGRFINGNRMALPVRFAAGSLGEGLPRRDLWVSPGHAMLVEDQLVHAVLLVNGVSITQAEAVDSVTYLNLELDDHDIILAEGVPAESFHDNGIRNVFANAAEFHRLYPDDPGPGLPCLPLLEQGFALEAIRRRIDARAGIVRPVPTAPGPLHGYVDVAGPGKVCGWAQDQNHPEWPVRLDVLVDGRRVLRILANRNRADLYSAGLGSGRHAFEVRLPDGCRGVVTVRRTADGAELPLTGLARQALAQAA